MVKEKAEKENRQVYVHGIEILDKQALPWIEFQPEDWHKLPHGAIIVIDEVHKVFPVRPVGSKTPDHVTPIGELRHSGYDMFVITQHPMELDSAVRRRVTTHLHCVRRMGMQACAVREWPRVVENCDKTDKGTVAQHEWVYNKAAYGWYKSAELHTIKRSIPAKLIWLLIAPVMLVIAVVYLYQVFQHQRSGEAIKAAAQANGGVVASSPVSGVYGARDVQLTPAQYAAQFVPRVDGLAHTAPVYDPITKPVRAPYPAACVESVSRCQCYSQQGTRLDVPKNLCHGIAEGGFFMAWDERKTDRDRQSSRVQSGLPAASASVPPTPSEAMGFQYQPAISERVSVLQPDSISQGHSRRRGGSVP